LLLAAGGSASVAYVGAAFAQSQSKIPRIGFIAGRGAPTAERPDPNFNYFRERLLKLGRIDGKNIHIEYRYADSSRSRAKAMVDELVRLKVDVIVTPYASFEAKEATKTIPIVALPSVDPVTTGLVVSLSRPGGNVTGVIRFRAALSGKLLELSKDLVPGLTRVGVLFVQTITNTPYRSGAFEEAARDLKIALTMLRVDPAKADFSATLRAALEARVNALVVTRSPLFLRNPHELFESVNKARLPTICEGAEEVASGGLLSYSPSDADSFGRAAVFVDKILKGAKPADLPMEQPTTFEMVVNMKTAKVLGITIPQIILIRADRLIE
jgi:putative ABC transport system substrate-binding protein